MSYMDKKTEGGMFTIGLGALIALIYFVYYIISKLLE